MDRRSGDRRCGLTGYDNPGGYGSGIGYNHSGFVGQRVQCRAGNRVALAKAGAKLPGGFKIKRSKIRGEVSEGMCCSLKELGLGEDAAGIMILSDQAPLGKPLEDVMESEGLADADVSFGVEISPNRPDCLGFIGLAREIAAKKALSLKLPAVKRREPETW